MFWTLFLLVLGLIALALIGMAISILIKKNGKFPETHIGRSKELQKRGISCAQTTDRKDRDNYTPIEVKSNKKHKS